MLALFALIASGPGVDLRLKIVPLDEAVVALAKASGLRLTADPRIADRKISLLLHGADAKETMTHVAEVMRLRWEDKDGGERLVPDGTLERRERAQVDAERSQAIQEVLGVLQTWPVAGKLPNAAQYAEGPGGRLPPEISLDFPLAIALGALDDGQMRRLLAGDLLVLGTDGDARLPRRVLDLPGSQNPYAQGDDRGIKPSRATLVMRLTDDGVRLQAIALYGFEKGAGWSQVYDIPRAHRGRREAISTSLTKELASWDQKDLEGPDAARRIDETTPERPSEWRVPNHGSDHADIPVGARSDSDRLEWLHDASGIDVIAMADRHNNLRPNLRFIGNVGDFVRSWRKESPDAFRLEDGCLLYRPGDYWRRNRAESPEKVLRTVEMKEEPSLEDWAALAAAITPEQSQFLYWGFVLMRREAWALEAASPLRLWNALDAAQRTRAATSDGIAMGSLNAPQQSLMTKAIVDALFDPQTGADGFARFVKGDQNGCRFWVEKRGRGTTFVLGTRGKAVSFSAQKL